MNNPAPLQIPFEVALLLVRYHVAVQLMKEGMRVKDLFDDSNYTPERVERALAEHHAKISNLQQALS